MARRWLIGLGIGLGWAVSAAAQMPEERPTALPPLLPVPAADPPAAAPVPPPPSGPTLEYDPGYLYIPDRDPGAGARPPRRFFDRWWIDPSLEFAWSSTTTAPKTLRLRPPDLFGRVAQLNVPLNGDFTDPFQFGFGMSIGRWFGEDRLHAVEGNLFLSGNTRSIDGFAQSTVVIFADGPGRSPPIIVRVPDMLDGLGVPFSATAETTFVGLDINYRVGLLIAENWRIDALAGYRYAFLQDELYLGDRPEDGEFGYQENRLTTKNSFHGGQIGLSGMYRTSAWYTEATAKLAYGGVTTRNSAAGALLYSQPRPWLGSTTQSAFLPSFNFKVGLQLSERSRLYAGYTFQYLSDVYRFGDALGCGCGDHDFWIQSVAIGFELGY